MIYYTKQFINIEQKKVLLLKQGDIFHINEIEE